MKQRTITRAGTLWIVIAVVVGWGAICMVADTALDTAKIGQLTGIHVVAIHHHMTMEAPRVVFLHYWGLGSTRALAKGLKAALDTQHK